MAKNAQKRKESTVRKATKRRKKTTGSGGRTPPASAPGAPALTVRHYCQGIGDCHLLTFTKTDGSPFRILIDCGIHTSISGGADLIRDIVADIKTATGGRIDVLVVTHEHWDHVSGFSSAADIFKELTVGEVWMAWSENARDPDTIAFDIFKRKALSALQGAALKLDSTKGLNTYAAGLRSHLHALLGFQFGAAGERVRAARDAAAKLSRGRDPVYLEPATPPFSIKGIPNLRIYVLGPPRDKDALKLEEKKSEMYALSGTAAGPFVKALRSGLGLAANDEDSVLPGEGAPFDPGIGTDLSAVLAGAVDGQTASFVQERYSGRLPAKGRIDDETESDQSWRRIDADWLGIAADLALQLDRGVNNSSLVLAFEMLDTGRVFLFPGDAQVGNWLSWEKVEWPIDGKVVKATDLMTRTVYLKVAHHGSQNATLEKKGLELMTNADLSAFIPTNKKDALKVRWGEMPYHGILNALAAKTQGRVIRADDDWLEVKDGRPQFASPSGSIRAVRSAIRDRARGKGGLWVEVDLA